MHTHANAGLTQKGRLRLIISHLLQHRPLAELAAEAGISLRCAYKWLARYRSGSAAALMDRRSFAEGFAYCKVVHRITGNRQQRRSKGVGYDRVHVAIDDATRLAYIDVLADEQQSMAIGFLSRALAWFNGQGVECR